MTLQSVSKSASFDLITRFHGKSTQCRNCNLILSFRLFREINFEESHTVEIMELYCHDFVAKIPSNQLFTKELPFKLIWRKNICLAENFSFFHTVEITEIYSSQKISSNQLFSNLSSKTLLSRNFCLKIVRVNFRNFHSEQIPWNQLFFSQKFCEIDFFTK